MKNDIYNSVHETNEMEICDADIKTMKPFMSIS